MPDIPNLTINGVSVTKDGLLVIDDTEFTINQVRSALRDKARLDFIQGHAADLRERRGVWEFITIDNGPCSEDQPSAREAIDVAMANLKPQTTVKE